MRWARAAPILALTFAAGASPARAECSCECVDGEVRPVCDSAIELEPICAARLCPTPPAASLTPIAPEVIPPNGRRECPFRQVLDQGSGEYQWRRICE